jgi:hypothetical protein
LQTLGLRAFPDQYVYVLLAGTQLSPVVVDKAICKPPAKSSWPNTLGWAHADVQELLTRHEVTAIQLKTVEGNARTKDPHRLQLEGVLIEATLSHISRPSVAVVVAQQIKKLTGFTSFARYLQQLLTQSDLSSVSTASYSDAALAALSGLPKE